MKIAFGCDHIVTLLKNELVEHFQKLGHTIIDCGTYDKVRTHYPMYGRAVAIEVVSKNADLGVVLCGTGVGIANAASKVKGSRTLLVTDPTSSRKAREEYNANIIAFGGRVIGIGTAIDIIQEFINAKYNGNNRDLINLIDNKISSFNSDPKLYNDILQKWTDGYYTKNEKQPSVLMPNTQNNERDK